MNSTDKLTGWIVTLAVLVFLGIYRLDGIHQETMQRISNANNQRAMSLKVELEQAKAEQMRYRALEVGYLCSFVGKDGESYFSEECGK